MQCGPECGHGGRTVGDALAENLVKAALDAEQQIDAELHRLDKVKQDDEDDLDRIRKERMDSMKKCAEMKQQLGRIGHGKYTEIFGEKEFFDACKQSKKLVVHFYRPSTWRCQIADKHLVALAPKYFECRFVKINAEKAPYLCDKLRIFCLPTLVVVKDGRTEHSFVGFDEFGDVDDFETELMEEKLAAWDLFKLKD
jgi:thiol-disulfide isomerase/thioredoxin